MTPLDPKTTALVLIDLQNGILSMPIAPRGGAEVLAAAKALARRFPRRARSRRAAFASAGRSDGRDALSQPVDQPRPSPPGRLSRGMERSCRGPRPIRRYRHPQAAMGRLLRDRARPAAPPTRRVDHRPRRGRHQLRRRIDGTRTPGSAATTIIIAEDVTSSVSASCTISRSSTSCRASPGCRARTR